MQVLVIYQMIPDEVKTAVVEMSDEEYAHFKKAHNVYVNAVNEDEEAEKVVLDIEACFQYVNAPTNDRENPIAAKHFNTWVNNPEPSPDMEGIDKLIFCGFYL